MNRMALKGVDCKFRISDFDKLVMIIMNNFL